MPRFHCNPHYAQATCYSLPFPAGIRREAEAAAGVVDFLLMASLAGGTGSGTGSALLQELADQYPASTLAAVAVAPVRTGGGGYMHVCRYKADRVDARDGCVQGCVCCYSVADV
jgi:hypothetical protein